MCVCVYNQARLPFLINKKGDTGSRLCKLLSASHHRRLLSPLFHMSSLAPEIFRLLQLTVIMPLNLLSGRASNSSPAPFLFFFWFLHKP